VRTLLTFLLLASSATAQQQWLGKKFMPRAGARYSRGTYQVPETQIGRPFTVQREVPGELLDIGTVYVAKSKVVPLAEAAAYYDAYLQANPKSDWAYTHRAIVWRERQHWDNAIRDYTEAIRLDPKSPWLRLDRGIMWRSKGQLAEALQDFNEALRLAPRGVVIYTYRGDLLRALGEYDAALNDFNAALRLLPETAWNYTGRGRVYHAQGNLAAALQDFDEALRRDAKNPQALNARAWLLATAPDEKIRDGRRALQDAQLAAELTNWSEVPVLDTLAAAHAETGDFAQAILWQENALVLDPDDKEAKTRLELYRHKKPYHGLPQQPPLTITSGPPL
jgi:tetratricopeptide (TPR) repeat protein